MFQNSVDLHQYSNYKIGGPASFFYHAKNFYNLTRAVERAKKEEHKIFVLGGGTNLLISDEGFHGLVLKPDLNFIQYEGEILKVGAGVLMSDLLEFAADRGLSGLEWAGGLPGTFGGAVRGNAGAFGGEIKDVVVDVASLDISSPCLKIVKRNNAECAFGYRNSIFKRNDGREIILEATLILQRGDKKAVRDAIEEKIKYRRERHPIEYPNVGSIFKNVDLKLVPDELHSQLDHVIKQDPFPVVPTAYLISEAGLKGIACGGAMISPKHPNFIVNMRHATAQDVKQLINLVKTTVKEKFNVELEEEIIYV